MFTKYRSQENFVPTQHVSRKDEYERRVPPRPKKVILSKSIENVHSSSTSITVLRTPPTTPKFESRLHFRTRSVERSPPRHMTALSRSAEDLRRSAAAQLQAERNRFDQAVIELSKCYDEILKVNISVENIEKSSNTSVKDKEISQKNKRGFNSARCEKKTESKSRKCTISEPEVAEKKREEERRLQLLHENLYLNRRQNKVKKDLEMPQTTCKEKMKQESSLLSNSTEFITNSHTDYQAKKQKTTTNESRMIQQPNNQISLNQYFEACVASNRVIMLSRKVEMNDFDVDIIPSELSDKLNKNEKIAPRNQNSDCSINSLSSPVSVDNTLNHHSNLHAPNPVYPPLDYHQTSPKPTRNRIGSGISAFRAVKNSNNFSKKNNISICKNSEAGKCVFKKSGSDQFNSFRQLVNNFENKLPKFMKKY